MIDIDAILRDVDYKPGYEFKNWRNLFYGGNTIELSAEVIPSRAWNLPFIKGDRLLITNTTYIDPINLARVTESEILQYLRLAAQNLEMHEVDEWLMYKGKLVNNPHAK